MKETTLWRHLDHPLSVWGKFQKVSDRFSGGVPDVIGSCRAGLLDGDNGRGIPVAMELKELEGVKVVKTKFRPGQLDWLRDWELGGGVSLILTSWGQDVIAFRWELGEALERGVTPQALRDHCLFFWTRSGRSATWREFVTQILMPTFQEAAKGSSPYSVYGPGAVLLRPDLVPSQGINAGPGAAAGLRSDCAARKASRAR